MPPAQTNLIPTAADAPEADSKALSLMQEGDGAMANSDFNKAADCYGRAMTFNVPAPLARRKLCIALIKGGEFERVWPLWREEMASSEESISWAQSEIERAMEQRDFQHLGSLARLLAYYRWGSDSFRQYGDRGTPVRRVPRDQLTVTKLRHDAGQFAYLRRLNLLGSEFDSIIATYQRLADRLFEQGGVEGRIPLEGEPYTLVGHIYNRIVYLPEVPRVVRALSSSWNPREVEASFLDRRSGVVVLDNFLTPEALAGIRRFAMQATVWSGIRYAYGRLGAFFNDGFNCPLLLQVAEELKRALPRVITDKFPIRQIWGFKNSTDLPPDSNLHADFASVNVNFWITPEDCNLDSNSGGMMVYDVDAPRAWDFHTYNGRTDIIKAFLRENRANETYIPYRQNRCIVFNSDLFHGTHSVHFKPGFENHRINVTMLYGQREDDDHHGSLSNRPDLEQRWQMQPSAWRSFAFRRR